tara:strand:- start:811 stop:1920 length:1110 start_codon:yes stop_codon:yes gene_type:complete
MNLNLTKIIDKRFLPILCHIIGLRKKKGIENPKKVLFLKMWSLGDAVLTLPLIKALRTNHQSIQIDVLCHKKIKAIFENNKNINNLMLFDTSLKAIRYIKLFKKYDLCIDTDPFLNISALASWYSAKVTLGFSHNQRSKIYDLTSDFKEQHTLENYKDLLKKLNIENIGTLEKIEVDNNTKLKARFILKKHNIQDKDFLIGIAPGVGESVKTRMWPLANLAKLADYLTINKNAKVIILDNQENKEDANKLERLMVHNPINLAGKTSINESIALIEKCNLFISNDTGPMHISAAQKTKTIGLFGPNTPIRWAPCGENISIYKKTNCSPCISNKNGITPECKYKGTPLEQHCMKNITVEEVIKKIEEQLPE